MVAVLSSLAAAVGVLLLILASAVALWRYRRGAVHPFTRRRKGSSISYSQQKDEVSTLSSHVDTILRANLSCQAVFVATQGAVSYLKQVALG